MTLRKDRCLRSILVVSALAAAIAIGSAACTAPAKQAEAPADKPAAPAKVHAEADGLALTPPMGWYPWNIFGEEPQNEKLIREIADALVASGMKDAGYAYVGPDEGICFSRGSGRPADLQPEALPQRLARAGRLHPRLGLKYALYTDAGSKTCSTAMPGTKGHELEDMRASPTGGPTTSRSTGATPRARTSSRPTPF